MPLPAFRRLAPVALAACSLVPLARAERVPRLVEVVALGDGLLARRDDGVVIVDGFSGTNGNSISPYEIPRGSSPLVTSASSAFTLAPPGKDRPRHELWELQLQPLRRRHEHPLPRGFTAIPVAADERWVHFDDGRRFDRRSREIVPAPDDEFGGARIVKAVTVSVPHYVGDGLPSVATYLLHADPARGGDGSWSLLRRWSDGEIERVALPAAESVVLSDALSESIAVVLDERRALIIETKHLQVAREIESPDAPLLSVHANAGGDDGDWLHLGAHGDCPATITRRWSRGDQVILTLPSDVRVAASNPHEIALAAPGSPARHLIVVQRREGHAYEVSALRLRDNGDRFLHGLKMTPAAIGMGVVALPLVIGMLAAEEMDTADADELAERQRKRRDKARAKVLPLVAACLGSVPEAAPCTSPDR